MWLQQSHNHNTLSGTFSTGECFKFQMMRPWNAASTCSSLRSVNSSRVPLNKLTQTLPKTISTRQFHRIRASSSARLDASYLSTYEAILTHEWSGMYRSNCAPQTATPRPGLDLLTWRGTLQLSTSFITRRTTANSINHAPDVCS